jgi:hypothetical protein
MSRIDLQSVSATISLWALTAERLKINARPQRAERSIAAWNECRAKANADTVLARCRFMVVGHSYNLPARCSAGSAIAR